MKWFWCALALMFACAAPAAPTKSVSTAPSACPEPRRSASPTPVCPQTSCPECPAPAPEPPPPEVSEWHCMGFYSRKFKRQTSFCWVAEGICQDKVKEARKKRMGNIGECQPQRVAYCMQIVDRPSMSRQHRCTQTMNSCQAARNSLRESAGFELVTECQPTLNTDPYTMAKDFTSRRAVE